ncbi:winged helix DNA-binding domain-containing protein [Mumia sp. zg.B21]|uniref:winged helix DNA-binding domain-containing protein n=2 Tax=unclassified Mumia TaxID=2621872 RepID=UPI001C6EBAE2|nr:winged helix DNA-binding domain-containing protein [Mumia sp. zg.B21]MBW9209722.1 winged helix DNA-binding domain-containing protein [Mumia sp. zg.B21]
MTATYSTPHDGDWSSLRSERLRRQGLVGEPFAAPVDVVEALCAVQAQEYVDAGWALAQRCAGVVTAADVDGLVASGELLRTHVLRPTWHFVRPVDVRWMLELTGPRIMRSMASAWRATGLDNAAEAAKVTDAVATVLADGGHLTRKELAERLPQHGVDPAGRIAFITLHAELDRVAISGVPRGKQQTFAAFDDRLPASDPVDRDEAVARLAERYLRGHGPATPHDLAWWGGVTVTDARRGYEAAGAVSYELEGLTYWDVHGLDTALPSGSGSSTSHLLPPYDEYLIAYKNRQAVDASADYARGPIDGLFFRGLVVDDGRVVGGWKWSRPTRKADPTSVTLTLLTDTVSADRDRFAAQAGRFSRYLDNPVELNMEAPR